MQEVSFKAYARAKVKRDSSGAWTFNALRCMHSVFPGNAKQRRQMRRWHRKNNPTCNDTLMENLRLGRRCTG